MSDLSKYTASPLRNLLVFRQKARLNYLQEIKAHIVLLYHFLYDKINLGIESLH
jgi:hypothetical protein